MTGRAFIRRSQTCFERPVPGRKAVVSYVYDTAANRHRASRKTMTDRRQGDDSYDSLERLAEREQDSAGCIRLPLPGISKTVRYDYNLNGSPEGPALPKRSEVKPIRLTLQGGLVAVDSVTRCHTT